MSHGTAAPTASSAARTATGWRARRSRGPCGSMAVTLDLLRARAPEAGAERRGGPREHDEDRDAERRARRRCRRRCAPWPPTGSRSGRRRSRSTCARIGASPSWNASTIPMTIPREPDERGEAGRRGAEQHRGDEHRGPVREHGAGGRRGRARRARTASTVLSVSAASIGGTTIAQAPGTRAKNSAVRERPVAARSRNTPASMSAPPAVAPTIVAGDGAAEREQRRERRRAARRRRRRRTCRGRRRAGR